MSPVYEISNRIFERTLRAERLVKGRGDVFFLVSFGSPLLSLSAWTLKQCHEGVIATWNEPKRASSQRTHAPACSRSGCTLVDSGRWRALKASGGPRKLNFYGQSNSSHVSALWITVVPRREEWRRLAAAFERGCASRCPFSFSTLKALGDNVNQKKILLSSNERLSRLAPTAFLSFHVRLTPDTAPRSFLLISSSVTLQSPANFLHFALPIVSS